MGEIAYATTHPDGTVEVVTRARVGRTLARLRLRAAVTKNQERFDRCCHGGLVWHRLPLAERLFRSDGSTLEGAKGEGG